MDQDRPSPVRVEASVMFADVSGFTAMSEKLDPEAVTDIMNRCFAALESVVIVHGGQVLKYIGDCVMGGFGLDGLGPDAGAAQAVRAAIDLREALASFNREARDILPNTLELHVGVATGPVIAGEVGGRVRREFGVTGEVVNLANRLCDAAQRGDIAVSAATQERTRGEFHYRPMAPIAVKESAEPVVPWELRAAVQAERKAKFGSERRQATVLFADIIGFKALAQTMEADALAEVLNHCFSLIESVVRAHGGVVDKFIGECVMALFGVPNAIEDAPKQALNAAIEIRNAIRAFNRDTPLAVPLDVHMGVNTGLVIAGEIGGRVRRDFTVMGDTVNLASRLKDASAHGAIYVGPETHRYTRDRFDYGALPPLTLKNKAQPVPAWALRSEHAATHRAKVDGARISSAMVGRARELAQVNERVLQLIEGRGGSIAVVGEAGLGKSRLLAEVLWLDAVRDTLVLEGRSLSIGQNLSFHPFVDLLRQWAGIREDDSDTDAFETLERRLAAQIPEDHDEMLPFVCTLMGIELPEALARRLHGIEGDALERLILHHVRQLFGSIAAARPVLLIFEDLHWADDSSVRLIEALLRLAVDAPLLFVFLARPDAPASERVLERAREEFRERHLDLRLQPLTEHQAAALVQNLLNIEQLPYEVRLQITRVTEGNPFFIEEVVHSLIDSGAIEERQGRFHVTEQIHSFVVPGTVQEVIMSRIDRLEPATRHLVQVASVIGRSFFYSIIAEILRRQGLADESVDQELSTLKTRQLLLERKASWSVAIRSPSLVEELEYIFKHALAQQTIYESLLQKTRKEFHRTVGETIEAIFADRLSDFYGMLAYHYGRADDLPKTEQYLFLAGEAAARSAASSEALNFFREASRLYLHIHGEGGDPLKKATLEKNVGLALLNSGRLTESIQHFDVALDHLGGKPQRNPARLYAGFATDIAAVLLDLYVLPGARHPPPASARDRLMFEVIFNRARALTTSDPQRLFLDNIGAVRRISRVDRREIPEAFEIYTVGATLFAWSGLSYSIAHRLADAAAALASPDLVGQVFLTRFLAFALQYLEGRWATAPLVAPDLVEQALASGRFWDVQTYLGLACDFHLRRGEFREAREHLERLATIRDAYSYEFAGTNFTGMSALVLLEERRLDDAAEAAEKYLEMVHDDPLRVLALGTRASVALARGQRDRASESLLAIETLLRQSPVVPPWHLSAYARARSAFDIDAAERARDGERRALLKQARASTRRLLRIGRTVALCRVEGGRLAARLAWLEKRPASASKWWGQALRDAERLGARPGLARTLLDIEELAGGANAEVAGATPGAHGEHARRLLAEMGLRWDLRQRPARLHRVA